jgi:hypothetical protein
MKVRIKSYAKNPTGTIQLHDYTREYYRLDKLQGFITHVYESLCQRSGHTFTDELREEAKTHAYALWIACDKMQVINKVKDTRYVLDVTVESGEHNAT